ncbi:hypothetical protein LLEC1_00798 [Akanthomyces lecanii]|uniref:Uncharacterized protein n=1 Tax=Cordyceps confragosa TaxID=2714763 RepID=A0A179I9F0_CORDF|nr:hypothetical protein LLEC1_00798 [Akanthomyces lecanii]
MGVPERKTPASVAEYVLSVLDASERLLDAARRRTHAIRRAAARHWPIHAAANLRALTGDAAKNLGRQASAQSVGRVGHETLGGAMLLALGFPEKVARLVESHVASKRYLCAVDASYYDKLSEASKRSLINQGGYERRGEGAVCGRRVVPGNVSAKKMG